MTVTDTIQRHSNTFVAGAGNHTAPPGMPLAMVSPGTEVHIGQIHGKPDVKRFLNNLGFVEHAAVTVITELDGNVIVSVKGARVAISKAMATRIHTM